MARVYDPGDEIYLFGFSRGAFTVRTLAGLVAACGILDQSKLEHRNFRGLESAVARAYRSYRARYRPVLWPTPAGSTKDRADDFRRKSSYDYNVRIRFIGVWDTVDAVGLPFYLADLINIAVYRFKFPDLSLTPIVDGACQALAIDEEREAFAPVLWCVDPTERRPIHQVWFAGAHSNVGGGYPKQGMSLVTLDWMLAHAQQAGLVFGKDGLRLNRFDHDAFKSHASCDDKLYDSRSGLGSFYRWKIRDLKAICDKAKIPVVVHSSVLERLAHGTDDYAPGNIPNCAILIGTETVDTNRATLLSQT